MENLDTDKCEHKECEKKKSCPPGHEECQFGCDDMLHSMARGPGGWFPSDDMPLGSTD